MEEKNGCVTLTLHVTSTSSQTPTVHHCHFLTLRDGVSKLFLDVLMLTY